MWRRFLRQMSAQGSIQTEYPHIVLNQNQVPVISGTTLKVVELVMAQRAYGWTPKEIQINHRNSSFWCKLWQPNLFVSYCEFRLKTP